LPEWKGIIVLNCFRRTAALSATLLFFFLTNHAAIGRQDATDPLPSWNDGAAKKAILEFVRVTTDKANPNFVSPEQHTPRTERMNA
jgi:hypothetical protein